MTFYWKMQYELSSKSDSRVCCVPNTNCALPYMHDFLYNTFSEDELIKACESDSLRLTLCTQTHGKNVSDVINFLKRYPVVCSLTDGERMRMLQITGGHLATNAFWWASVYCNLKYRNTVDEKNSTKKLYKLIEASYSGDGFLYSHAYEKRQTKDALDRLIAGKEPPLYTQGFYHTLTRGL